MNNPEYPEFNLYEFTSKRTEYCICIPVINEGEKFRRQLANMRANGISQVADIIICDGKSTDNSVELDYLKKMDVSALLIKEGIGRLGAQLRMGFHFALSRGYKGIITMDGNGKDNVEAIPDFINNLSGGYDFIQGSRYLPGGRAINTPVIRTAAIRLIHVPIISLMAGFGYTDTTNAFRAYSKKLLSDDNLAIFRSIFSSYEILFYISVKAPRFGFRVKEIPVTRSYPKNGKTPTKISPIRGNLYILKTLLDLFDGKYDKKTD